MAKGLIFVFLVGCGSPYYGFANVTDYRVDVSARTPEGIGVDASGFQVDLSDVDRRTDMVESCLRSKFPDGKLPSSVTDTGHCLGDVVDLTVHRDYLKVKVAPDWHVGCTGEQQFPCSVDPALCVAKGLTPTPECPCECRSAIQDEDTIVVTPDLHLYTGDLIRLQTTCNMIWNSELQDCYAP